jgi:hypothetical protein
MFHVQKLRRAAENAKLKSSIRVCCGKAPEKPEQSKTLCGFQISLCETRFDENSLAGGLHATGSKLSNHRDWRPFMTNKGNKFRNV